MFPPISRTAAWLARLLGWRADLAALALGAMTALALPPVHALPLLWLTLPGLLWLVDGAGSAATAGRRGWWFGFGLYLLGLYWITEAILVESARYWWLVPFAVPAIAAVLAVFVALATWLAGAAEAGWRRILVLAGAWVLLDIARQFVASGFPWNPLGSVWELPGAAGDVMIQPAAWVGVHGLTLATLLVALAPAAGRRAAVGAVLVLAAWAGGGAWRLAQPAPSPPGVAVVLVQGNVPQGQKWDRSRASDVFHRYLRLTQAGVEAAGDSPVVVVWPETAAPYLLENDQRAREMIAEAAGGGVVLAGAVRFGRDDRPRNSLFALLPGGVTAAIYDKWHLVPFGEYQPDWLPLGIQVVPGGGFAPGPGARTLHVPGLPPVGPLICYEAIFPGSVIDGHDRPAWMVNVTNDAWFGNSTGPRQHLAAARLRAVEEGLPLFRAANTGISGGFDSFGRELGRISLNEMGTLTLGLPAALPETFFGRWGLWSAGLAAFFLLLCGLSSGLIRVK